MELSTLLSEVFRNIYDSWQKQFLPNKSRMLSSTAAVFLAILIYEFPQVSSFSATLDSSIRKTHAATRKPSRLRTELLAVAFDANIDVTKLLDQEQEAGIAFRAVEEASLMKPMQEELLVNDLTERLAAIKRVKNSLSKIRAPFVSGFGKTASKNGKGKKTEKEPSIATIKPVFKDKEGYSSILHENGVVRINNVMPLSTTQALYSWICEEKIASEKSIAEGMIDSQSRFTNALLKKNRWDLLLPLEDSAVVMKGLYDTLVANELLSSIISSRFGASAELYELGALISDPGSDRQVIHPDIPFTMQASDAPDTVPIITCFIALQDIDADMGATVFLPKTNTAEHHRLLKDPLLRDEMLQSLPNKLSTLGVGDCSIFDGRLLHAGGANETDKRRILFYFTFRNPALPDPRSTNNPGSIRSELKQRKLTLRQIQDIVRNSKTFI